MSTVSAANLNAVSMGMNWKSPVKTAKQLPTHANTGDTMMCTDTGSVYIYDGTSWVEITGSSMSVLTELFEAIYNIIGARPERAQDLLKVIPRLSDEEILDLVQYSRQWIELFDNPSPEMIRRHKLKWEL